MSFTVRRVGSTLVVEVDGQLIVGNRHELKEMMLEKLAGGVRNFIVDFARTGYIDSSGLGVLVGISKRVREVDGTLQLTSLSHDLMRLFELTKLDTLFTIRGSVEEALAD